MNQIWKYMFMGLLITIVALLVINPLYATVFVCSLVGGFLIGFLTRGPTPHTPFNAY